MPFVTSPALTGHGHTAFTGGPFAITDVDVGVNVFPVTAGFGYLGDSNEVKHVGLIGLYFGPPPVNLGTYQTPTPTIEVAWWDYVSFIVEDKGQFNRLLYQYTGYFWSLVPGATIHTNWSY